MRSSSLDRPFSLAPLSPEVVKTMAGGYSTNVLILGVSYIIKNSKEPATFEHMPKCQDSRAPPCM